MVIYIVLCHRFLLINYKSETVKYFHILYEHVFETLC